MKKYSCKERERNIFKVKFNDIFYLFICSIVSVFVACDMFYESFKIPIWLIFECMLRLSLYTV